LRAVSGARGDERHVLARRPDAGKAAASQVLSTPYQAIDIDPPLIPDTSAQPMHFLDDCEPITELL
jgi:hypothetical protein